MKSRICLKWRKNIYDYSVLGLLLKSSCFSQSFDTPPTRGWARISSGLKPDLPLCTVSLWKLVLALSESQMYIIMREGGRVHLIKMQRKPSGSYKSDQPPHSPIIRTNCKEAALLKFQVIRCHNCEHCRIVCLFVTEEIPVFILGLTPLFGDRRGFMPAQLKTNKQSKLV